MTRIYVSLTHRPPFTVRKIPGTCQRLSQPTGPQLLEGSVLLKTPKASSGIEPRPSCLQHSASVNHGLCRHGPCGSWNHITNVAFRSAVSLKYVRKCGHNYNGSSYTTLADGYATSCVRPTEVRPTAQISLIITNMVWPNARIRRMGSASVAQRGCARTFRAR
jgi:hypothetical protein